MNAKARDLYTFVWPSIFLCCSSPVTVATQSTNKVWVDETKPIAVEAYGYSPITTNVTRVQMTNVHAVESFQGPLNGCWSLTMHEIDKGWSFVPVRWLPW